MTAPRAAVLIRQGHPLEAAHVLDGVGRLMFRDLDAPFLQASALLAGGDKAGAERGFRAILAQTGFGWDTQYPLAHLGLARALRQQGDAAESRREYAAFLRYWTSADADLAPLRQARLEMATLPAATQRPSPESRALRKAADLRSDRLPSSCFFRKHGPFWTVSLTADPRLRFPGDREKIRELLVSYITTAALRAQHVPCPSNAGGRRGAACHPETTLRH